MKCATCGRGITWRRMARDGAFMLYREGMDRRDSCGQCIERGRQPIPEGTELWMLVPKHPLDYRLMTDEYEVSVRLCSTQSLGVHTA